MIIVAQQYRLFVVFTHILLALLSDGRIICQQIWRKVHRAGAHFALHITKNRRWTEALAQACLALGGEPQPVPKSADVCSKIPILPFFPVIFQFWEGDE